MTTLVSDSEEKVQHLLNIIVNESINIKKTECMIIIKNMIVLTCKIYIHGKRIRQMESFNYLESTVTSNGKCCEDIKKQLHCKVFIYKNDQHSKEWGFQWKLN